MIDSLISPLAPHLCYGCGKIGVLLCDYCKYNIVNEQTHGCILCSNNNIDNIICYECQNIAQRGWCVGERADALRRLIDAYKFENAKAAHKPLADLLDSVIPDLPSQTIIVPVPTVSAHIRQRGYDHTAILARSFAKKRGMKYQPILQRATKSSQRGASRAVRLQQAASAFSISRKVESGVPYLIIDDIATTGSTLRYAAKVLRTAGVTEVWTAVVARQPLD